jgi:hypothetical protein
MLGAPFITKVYSGVTLKIATVNDPGDHSTGAFITGSSVDFSIFPNRTIQICSSGGNCVSAFIGVKGTSETLSPTERVTNGDNEAAVYSPRFNVRSSSAQSADVAQAGTYSCKTTSDGTPNNNFYSRLNQAQTAGALYKGVAYGYNATAQGINSLYMQYSINSILVSTAVDTTKDAWIAFTLYGTSAGDLDSFWLAVITPSIVDPTGKYFYSDSRSLKQVLTPAADGIWLTSERGGLTKSVTGTTGTFNPLAASYTVTVSR